MRGSKSVVITDSGNVAGNVFSPTVTLVEGATFNGTIDMSEQAKSEQQRPEPVARQADNVAHEPAKKTSVSGKKSVSAA